MIYCGWDPETDKPRDHSWGTVGHAEATVILWPDAWNLCAECSKRDRFLFHTVYSIEPGPTAGTVVREPLTQADVLRTNPEENGCCHGVGCLKCCEDLGRG